MKRPKHDAVVEVLASAKLHSNQTSKVSNNLSSKIRRGRRLKRVDDVH
jgi:hypothetical protein